MVHINFMGLHKEKFLKLQEYCCQYMALCNVCTELGLKIWSMCRWLKGSSTSEEQLSKALDQVAVEHHMIIFLYKVGQMEIVVLQKKEMEKMSCRKNLFLKTVSNMCRVLAGLKNKYISKFNSFSDAKNGISFTKITWYKCNKIGHYSKKNDEDKSIKASNKNGSTFFVLIQEWKNIKSESEAEQHYRKGQ